MKLRKIQDSDFDFLCKVELDPLNNSFSTLVEHLTPEKLMQFIQSDHNLTKHGQLRLVMDLNNEPVGFLDLYDYNSDEQSAGMGIIVHHSLRLKGIGKSALDALFQNWMSILNLKKIYADVEISNTPSRTFFEKVGFAKIGLTEKIERFVWEIKG